MYSKLLLMVARLASSMYQCVVVATMTDKKSNVKQREKSL